MTINRNYKWNITTLTPLHIGSGNVLREGFDFVSYENKLWIANQGAIFAAMLPKAGGMTPEAAQRIAATTLIQMLENGWLQPDDFNLENGFFRYSIEGQTSTSEHQGQLHEMLKDVFMRPYIPGSSFKGVLRSALLKRYVNRNNLEINFRDGRYAAQFIENNTFVPNPLQRKSHAPNYSLWRAVKLSDSQFLSPQNLALAKVITFPMAKKNSSDLTNLDQDFEVLPAGLTFTTLYQIETRLFDLPVRRGKENDGLQFTPEHLKWFTDNLCSQVNKITKARLNADILFFDSLSKNRASTLPFEVVSTLHTIANLKASVENLKNNEMVLPVGRGTGWLSKTLGTIFQDELAEGAFKNIVDRFNLGRKKWSQDDFIPYTRMLATCGDQVRVPMGWVKIAVDEIK